MTNTIFDTTFSKNYNLELLAKHSANELQASITLDLEAPAYLSLVRGITPIIRSPMSEAFLYIKKEDLLKNVCYISNITDRKSSLPELLTITDLTVYGKQVRAVKQSYFKGAWTDIGPMLSNPKDRFDTVTIKSANEIIASTTRAILCMAYEDSKDWLNSKGKVFVIDVYSRAMGTIVNRLYKLDVEESAIVRYAFAYYYASLLTDKRDSNNAPEILNRCTQLFQNGKVNMEVLAERMYNIVGKSDVTMEHVAEFVVQHGPSRAKGFDASNVYRSLFNSSKNSVATFIAADYPPYMVYLILRAVSGDKHPILTNVLNNMFTRQQVTAEVGNIVKDKSTYSGIRKDG